MNNTNVGVLTTSNNVDVSTKSIEGCLKGTYKFTEVVYTNVCNGQQYSVPNGFWDYSLLSLIVVFVVLLNVVLSKTIFD